LDIRAHDFPLLNPLRSEILQGTAAFLTKINANGTALIYSTFLGATDSVLFRGICLQILDLVLDSSGNVCIPGGAFCDDWPVTPGAFQSKPTEETWWSRSNAFVTKISSDGATLLYSTYLGGTGFDVAYAIAVDDEGYA